jgi:alanine racemase
VLLLGEGQEQAITADDLADLVGTIPYEILTNINGRVPRVYVNYLESTGLNGE